MTKNILNDYWKAVVDTIQDGVMIVNPEGMIISVNRGFEEITGYRRDEILGCSCTVLNCSACERARKVRDCHWCAMFKLGNLKKQKCMLIRKNGQPVHVLKNASVLKDEAGNITGAVETITDISDLVEKEAQIETYRRELDGEDRFCGMIGASAPMQEVFELITSAAQSDAPVIVYGESGTGKELVARAIHETGLRYEKPYIKVNCASLNESLLESELFGHVKGAFTGAHRSRSGRFEAADQGSIFLDEIGDIPLSTQVKLLRVLEEKVVERVGDHRPIKVDVRIISATNRNLWDLIRRGEFREDFFYRINVIPIQVPPLRERGEDISLLARSFFNRIKLKSGKKIEGISSKALEILKEYHWPGNVRELRSAFEFAFVSCRKEMIQPEHFPTHILNQNPQICVPAIAPSQSIEDVKKQRLYNALKLTNGNQSEAARLLGMSRTSVWQQMKRFNLRPRDFRTV
ncbi:MAG: sigma 54-interacting transcriptional regulator [Desulfobacteraceae bacterium]|jgi:PAS domain S-box-containing protein